MNKYLIRIGLIICIFLIYRFFDKSGDKDAHDEENYEVSGKETKKMIDEENEEN